MTNMQTPKGGRELELGFKPRREPTQLTPEPQNLVAHHLLFLLKASRTRSSVAWDHCAKRWKSALIHLRGLAQRRGGALKLHRLSLEMSAV